MQSGHRALLLGVVSLALISGCNFSSPWGSSSNGTEYGSTLPSGTGGSGSGGTGGGTGASPPGGVGGEGGTTGTDNTVVATPSVAGVVVATGANQTVSITFTSSDGLAITGFGISGSGALPAGWSGPGTFTCALVTAGSGCVLNLNYAPVAIDSGTLTINYVYVDNANLPRAPGGSVTIAYEAIPQNNVVATASPSGQINAIVGAGNQSVSVNFVTDDGNAATNLAVDLSALPSGWSSTATSLSCAIVSTGNGCELMLTYAPTTAGRGTLTLGYTYTDDSGASRIGSLNVPYSTTSANNIIATASPAGQVTAIEKTGGRAVAVTFTTDNGKAATNLTLTSPLSALPAGWSSSSKAFSCASVSTGNGCTLNLTYAPTALARGTLTLNYAYSDDAGTAETGSLNLAYAATTNDNVVATPSPSGQINEVVGAMGSLGSQAVSVTFTTDDGLPATALQLTSSLTALPSGWSSTDSTFTCSGLSSGNGCQLTLTYTPTAAGMGTLVLNYSYMNDAGEAKTGSLNIPYRATTNNNIVATASPSSLTVLTGSNNTVNVTFTTDDGNPASGLSVTSGLTPLPMDWTSTSSSFTCTSVSVGTGCQLTLTYQPTAAEAGMVVLDYSYTNNSGIVKTGTVPITYTATVPPP